MRLPPFQRFLDEHREPVYRFMVAAAGRADADDAFQETFLAALRAYPRLPPGSNLRAWVMTIAHRKALDVHRSRQRRPESVEAVPDRAGSEPGDPAPELWAAVRDLADGQRDAVLLRYVVDLTYRDVAAVLGCTEEAARQRVRDGLRRLRKRVGQEAR
ncbi:MAG: sigma-70 family RNA polymerase sigma factor [Actinomycetota bacterium]|nr:sigma-70 family RNA polymerase sigma factor [Actinomycetota bacterium]